MFVKLFENGYSPIPVYFKGKNPSITGWQKYCEHKPHVNQIEMWDDELHKHKINIGVAMGQASKTICLDIDTDDKEFLKSLPASPVRRRGQKGEARFFRYNPDIKSQSFPFLDVLSDGRQILVPPSVHPMGMNYEWLTPDTLENTKPEDLPELPSDFLSGIVLKTKDLKIETVGRNNKLVDIATAMRGRGEDESKIVNELYEWDRLHNKPRLFTDRKEGYQAFSEDEARVNAWRMLTSITRTLIDAGVSVLSENKMVVQITEEDEKKVIDLYKSKDYPEPTGLMKDIRDLTVEYSERLMPNIALGGAVSLMAAVCSNRFRFNQCWSNMYVLNLAPTGTGKSFPQKIISMILDERLGTNLIGYGNYQSSSAFTKNMVSRRERFDVIDEISSLFAQMKSGGLWQMGILEEMCKVWSSSSGKFNAAEYAEKEDTSSCFNPCINILGSSTIDGIMPNINKMMVIKGLIPRFIIFKDENSSVKSKDKLNEKLLGQVSEKISAILNTEKRIRTDIKSSIIGGPIYDPVDLAPTQKDAIDCFEHIKDDFFNRISQDIPESTKNMLTRGKEQTMKLAIGHAAGNFRAITVDDLIWAKQMFEVSLHNSINMIHEATVDTEWEKDVESMISLLKKHAFVTDRLIGKYIKRIKPQRKKEIIEHLLTSEQISRVEKLHKGKTINGWKLV
jgi:hypothetical protein